VTGRELVEGLEAYLRDPKAANISDDARDWFKGMEIGLARRTGLSTAMRSHGNEANRASHRNVGAKKKKKGCKLPFSRPPALYPPL
jgi:hypothetical protein